jgi:hypothetical protein
MQTNKRFYMRTIQKITSAEMLTKEVMGKINCMPLSKKSAAYELSLVMTFPSTPHYC